MYSTLLVPLHVFRFQVDFVVESISSGATSAPIAGSGAFSECSGLEATMEPKVIREGGLNYGAWQRAGPTNFATVVLKRGISANGDIWTIFNNMATGLYAPRMQVTINVFDIDGSPGVAWQLDRAMPIKYKFADLNAKGGGEVGIEELHLVHEGLSAGSPISLDIAGS